MARRGYPPEFRRRVLELVAGSRAGKPRDDTVGGGVTLGSLWPKRTGLDALASQAKCLTSRPL